jgi:steroid 5-alpha reductase family enzyme
VIERKTEQLKEAVNKDQTLYTIRETYNIKVKINNRGNEYRYMILVLDIGTSKIESIVFKGFKFDQVVKGGKIKWIFMNNGDREIGIEVVVIN